MAITQPVLASNTLAYPDAEEGHVKTLQYRGGVSIMADGTQVTDLVQTGAKVLVKLKWSTLTATELSTLLTAVAAVKATSGAYTDLDGVAYTVTLDGMGEVAQTSRLVAGGVVRYATEIKLREA